MPKCFFYIACLKGIVFCWWCMLQTRNLKCKWPQQQKLFLKLHCRFFCTGTLIQYKYHTTIPRSTSAEVNSVLIILFVKILTQDTVKGTWMWENIRHIKKVKPEHIQHFNMKPCWIQHADRIQRNSLLKLSKIKNALIKLPLKRQQDGWGPNRSTCDPALWLLVDNEDHFKLHIL
jgi:hypothetical protein